MNIALFCAAFLALQVPESDKKADSEAAMAWLAKAEKALLEATVIELKVERKLTLCMAPETWIRKAEVTVIMGKGGLLAIDNIERLPKDKPGSADEVCTRVRCDGRTFGVAEGPDPVAPKRAKCRAKPTRFDENAAAVFIRVGVEVAYLGWPIAEFTGDELSSDEWRVEKVRIVEEGTLRDRPCVQLEYEVSCFGKIYRHQLWLDRETRAPLKRKCQETDIFDHARIMSYEETYELVKRDLKFPESAFAIPKSWTKDR